MQRFAQDFHGPKGLGHAQGQLGIHGLVAARHGDNFAAGARAGDGGQQVDTIHLRHEDVGNGQINDMVLQEFKGFLTVAGLQELVSGPVENLPQHRAHYFIIVYEQNN